MGKTCFLEIGCEEIPARFVPVLLDTLKRDCERLLGQYRLDFDSIRVDGTYRRLALWIDGCALKQRDESSWIKGPPTRIGMDAEGKLTKAAEGFAKKNGVLPKALTVKTLDGQDYLGVPRQEKGRLATQVLAELLPVLITDLSLPLAMTWGPAEFRFIRPVHWMVSLFGKQVIRFSCFGKTSGRVSYGHRFLSGGASLLGKAISLASAEDVEASLLKEGKVMLAAKKRRQRIRKDLAAEGLSDVDEALLDEVVYLVEKPTVLRGGFDRKFLSLPDVVLIESMKKHQRYFSVFSQKKILKAGFLCVADNVSRSNKAGIIKGNERVLAARLDDAYFFFNDDKTTSLFSKVSGLKGVLFQKNCGTMFDKKERLKAFLGYGKKQGWVSVALKPCQRVLELMKVDLLTQMVGEFPSLQGSMGAVYAAADGEDEALCLAIQEQYMPVASQAALPASELGAVVSVLDRLDTVVMSFHNGANPTGSQDPLGLRRALNGVFAIVLDRRFSVELSGVVDFFDQILDGKLKHRGRLESFVQLRLKHFLMELGLSYDVAAAVCHIAIQDLAGALDLGQMLMSARQQDKAGFKVLVETAVRVKRLAVKSNGEAVSVSLFEEKIEEKAYTTLKAVKVGSLSGLSSLTGVLTTYFEDVFVMADTISVKNNRLAFLKAVDDRVMTVADFEKLVLDA